jgi:hypothetical protein
MKPRTALWIVLLLIITTTVAALLWSGLSKLQYSADLRGAHSSIRVHAYGLVVYAENNSEVYPAESDWYRLLVDHGIVEPAIVTYRDRDKDGDVYTYVPGCTYQNPNQIMLYEDLDHWKEGVIVGFADGDAQLIPHYKFHRRIEAQLQEMP